MLSIRFKRGTAAANDALTENAGVLTIDTDSYGLRIHDGITAGGHKLIVQQSIVGLQDQIDGLSIVDVSGLDAALAAKIAITELGMADGVAQLNPEGVVPTEQLPSYVEDIIEVASISELPATGEIGKLYLTADASELYRWSGGQQTYYQITAVLDSTEDLSEGQVNLYFTEQRARESISATGGLSYDSATGILSFTESINSVNGYTGAVVVSKGDVDLGNVENYGVAIQSEAEAATVTNKYLTPGLTRAMVEGMGFTDAEGNWRFASTQLESVAVAGSVTALEPFRFARFEFGSFVHNGYFYAFGGRSSSNGQTFLSERLNLSTGVWETLTNTPATYWNTRGLLYNGKGYVGWGTQLYQYEPSNDTWTAIGPGSIVMDDAASVAVNGKIYFTGGTQQLNSLRVFDIATEQWETLPNGPDSFRDHFMFHHNGYLYVGGGSEGSGDIYRYDIATSQWDQSYSIGNAAVEATSTGSVFTGDLLYTVKDSNELNVFDPANDQWSAVTLDSPIGVDYMSMCERSSGKLLLSGGRNGSTTYSGIYVVE